MLLSYKSRGFDVPAIVVAVCVTVYEVVVTPKLFSSLLLPLFNPV